MTAKIKAVSMWMRVQIELAFITKATGHLVHDFWRVRDLGMVRAILGIASVGWGLAAICQPGTFNRPTFVHLAQFLGAWPTAPARLSEVIWGLAFIAHGIGLWMIAVYRPTKDTWPLIVNGFGLFVWAVTAAGTNWAVHSFSPGNAAEWTLCGFASFALYRTEFSRMTNA